jgi:tight adherence protein B
MSTPTYLGALVGVSAVGAAVLAWLLIDIGIKGLRNYQQDFAYSANFQVKEFFAAIDPSRLFVGQVCIVAIGFCLGWLLSGKATIGVAVACITAMMPRMVYARLRQRRLRRFEEQLPDALLLMASGLRAGLSFHTATSQVVEETEGPLGQEFGLMLREQRLGLPQDQCLASLVHRVPTPTTVLVTAAIRIALETGGGLAEMLEHTATTVRSRLQMEGKIQALTAQGRAQAWVTSLLPVIMVLIFDALGQDTLSFLFDTQIGWATVAVLLLLEGVGVFLIRKIVRIDV